MQMTERPDPPDGYTDPGVVPGSRLRQLLWLLIMLGISIVVYLPDVRRAVIENPVSLIAGFSGPIHYFGAIAGIILLTFVNMVIHERVHKVASRLTGYESVLRLKKPIRHGKEPHNYIPNAWVNGGDYKLILLAPLFAINLFAASLVIMAISPVTTTLGKAFLVVNTATSGDDVRMFIRGLTSDESTKYHHGIDNHSLVVYESVESDE